MKSSWHSFWRWVSTNLRRQFLTGILVMIPLAVTTLIFVWIFNSIDNILQPVIKSVFGYSIRGFGFGVTIVLIYLAGVIASGIGGKAIIRFVDTMVGKVPIVRLIYNGTKQILESFSMANSTHFMQVVLLEFPRKGVQSIGFITNEMSDKTGKKLFTIFVPTAPNPTSGFLQIVEESEITRTKMSVDDALKMVVSAGRTLPPEAREKLFSDN